MNDSELVDEAAFLVRSENRVRVLERLGEGACEKTELQQAADTSRVTVGRVINDLQKRHWVVEDGREYRLTRLGRDVLDGLNVFLKSITAAQKLRNVIEHLPGEEFDVPLRHLHDATITRPSESIPSKHIHRFYLSGNSNQRILGLWSFLDPEIIRLTRDFATQNAGTVEIVCGKDVLDIHQSEYAEMNYLSELVKSKTSDVYECNEPLPGSIFVFGNQVLMVLTGDDGYEGVIETSNVTIRTWAEDIFERYRDRSKRIETF